MAIQPTFYPTYLRHQVEQIIRDDYIIEVRAVCLCDVVLVSYTLCTL